MWACALSSTVGGVFKRKLTNLPSDWIVVKVIGDLKMGEHNAD